jgi:phospholipid/cholesterol/gamma-HCH transport system substrate-binding protein
MIFKPLRAKRIEWIAGLFVVACLLQITFMIGTIAYKKGWFERKVRFKALLDSSEGIRVGSPVEMSGLRVGAVEDIELNPEGGVRVLWYIFQRYSARVTTESRIQVLRPFIIGEKTLLLSQGNPPSQALAAGSEVPAENIVGLGDLINGKHFAPYVGTLSRTMELLKNTTEALLKLVDSDSSAVSVSLIHTLRQMQTTFLHLSKITSTIAKGDRVDRILQDLQLTSTSLAKWLPDVERSGPQLAQDLTKLLANLTVLTDELKKVAPELPKQGERLAEAVDEAVVVLKALQKTFLLSSSAREVKEEERKKQSQRSPAEATSPEKPKGGAP